MPAERLSPAISSTPYHSRCDRQRVEENKLVLAGEAGVSKTSGIPKWMVKIMENPYSKWMIWGKPLQVHVSNKQTLVV